MRRVPILQRGSDEPVREERLEFLVQHLPKKPIIGEPIGRVNGATNQYLITVHRANHPVELIIVTGPESAARVYKEKYPTALVLLNLDSEPYQRFTAYIKSCSTKIEEP